MKIFHISDLHIGKVLNGFTLIEDQKYVLQQIKEFVKDYKPDVIVIAGDIYDRSVPSSSAIELLNEFLGDILIKMKTTIIAVAGNHDGANWIEYGNDIFEKLDLYIEGRLKKEIKKVVLNDEYGEVNFYLLPFADYAVVRDVLEKNDIKSLDDAMKALIEKIMEDFDETKRNVLVTHGNIAGDECLNTRESEKPLIIGGKESVNVDIFEKFNYVALGHLHSYQRVKSDKVMYSGSILKYSFSEEDDNKGIAMVDIDKDGNIKSQLLLLNPMRNMRTIEGELDYLLNLGNKDNKDDYIRAIVTDECELIEPMAKLRKVYPNIMLLELKRQLGELKTSILSSDSRGQKNPIEIFSEFYKYNMQEELSDKGYDVINKIIESIEEEN